MLNPAAQRTFLFLLIAGIAILSLFNVVEFFIDLHHARKAERVAVDLRKLNIMTLGLVRRADTLRTAELERLVKEAGLELDPWKNAYQRRGDRRTTEWRSAGRDRRWDTRDDIVMPLSKVAAQLPDRELADEMKAIKDDEVAGGQ